MSEGMKHIHICSGCRKYTMENVCTHCGSAAVPARPPKFSPDDKYAGLRREVKKKELEKKGLYS